MENNENKIVKPVKPTLEEYNLSEQQISLLTSFKQKCSKIADKYLLTTFIVLSLIGVSIVIGSNLHLGFLVLSTTVAVILAWGVLPPIFQKVTSKDLKDFIYNRDKNENIASIDESNRKYQFALVDYKNKNELYERILRRRLWEHWLSLSPVDFEEAVGDLFLDKGYEVWTTKATGDHGVDLYMEKDGKKFVVQCKTYKKALGPNAVRDLYGTMMAQEADEAFLAAPSGFTMATKEFCNGKPIKLLDIDELTQMAYDFDSYIPYWIDSAKSVDDAFKYINKNIIGKQYRGRRY